VHGKENQGANSATGLQVLRHAPDMYRLGSMQTLLQRRLLLYGRKFETAWQMQYADYRDIGSVNLISTYC